MMIPHPRIRRVYYLPFFLLFLSSSALAFGRALPKRPCPPILVKPATAVAPSAVSRADSRFSILLPDAPVKDQGDYGCCWISSALGKWERAAKAKFKREIKFSENHMILASLFYRVEEALYNGMEISQGGWAETADWMATHIGLVPEEFCKWKVDLRNKYVGDEVVAYLNVEVADFQAKLLAMRESGTSEKAAWDFTQKTKSRLLRYLRERVGNFPSSFVIEGKKFTPHSFAAEFAQTDGKWIHSRIAPEEMRIKRQPVAAAELVTDAKSLFELYPKAWLRMPGAGTRVVTENGIEARDILTYQLFARSHRDGFRRTKAPLAEIHSTVVGSLAMGEPVYLGLAMVKDFYRNDTGIMSLAAYGKTVEDAKRAKFSGGHAVLITGAYFDGEGRLLGYRIQNSWGKASGSAGYYTIDRDYFDSFMSDVVVKTRIP